jgi:1-acyl-sn-glycerol-3-phosphate acyltransferase
MLLRCFINMKMLVTMKKILKMKLFPAMKINKIVLKTKLLISMVLVLKKTNLLVTFLMLVYKNHISIIDILTLMSLFSKNICKGFEVFSICKITSGVEPYFIWKLSSLLFLCISNGKISRIIDRK